MLEEGGEGRLFERPIEAQMLKATALKVPGPL